MISRGDRDRRRHRKGMTMVEVLACLAIMAVLMLAVMKVMMTSSHMFHDAVNTARVQRMTESLSDLIREQLTYAESLEIAAGGESILEDTGQILFTEDGQILWNGKDLYGEEFYTDYRFYCKVEPPEGSEVRDVLKFTLFLENNRKEALYSFRTVVKLVNLELRDIDGIVINGELTGQGNLDSHSQELCFRFQSPGDKYLQEEESE